MEDSNGRVVMKAQEMQATLERMAGEIIGQSMDPKQLALVGIHTGGVHLARRLESIMSRKLSLPVPVGTLDINLYRDDWTLLHTQPQVRASDLPFRVDDRDLVLVDDVLFTGRTIRAALDALTDYGRPRRVQVAVLVDRGHRELPICGQFIGISLETLNDEQVNVLLTEKDGVDQVVIEARPARKA
jgi:pyrimidine operon attenuation protein / uracil phosphoribosyltransferase